MSVDVVIPTRRERVGHVLMLVLHRIKSCCSDGISRACRCCCGNDCGDADSCGQDACGSEDFTHEETPSEEIVDGIGGTESCVRPGRRIRQWSRLPASVMRRATC